MFPPKAKNLNVKNKKVLITGGNAGLGAEVVKQLAQQGCTNITIAARNAQTASQVILDAKKANSQGINPAENTERDLKYDFLKLDLSDQKGVIAAAEKVSLETDFDVIICNSGVYPGSLKRTMDGFEWNFGINHLGHYSFILTYLNAKKGDLSKHPKRIVMLGSCAHLKCKNVGLDFDDLNYEKREKSKSKYDAEYTYGEGKFMNILFAKSLSEKLNPKNTVTSAVHPGICHTDLFKETPYLDFFMGLMFRSSKNGAQTILYTGFSDSEKVTENSGSYFENCGPAEGNLTAIAKVREQRERLWAESVKMTGIDLEYLEI